MKSEHYKKVEELMVRAGQNTPAAPVTELSDEDRILRAKLIIEEALETIQRGLGVKITMDHFDRDDIGPFEPSILEINYDSLKFETTDHFDLIEIIDGCCDIKVVTTGTLVACGVPDEPFQDAVDENNLAKFGPGGYRRDDGKWVKPPGHVPPDIAGILNEIKNT